MTAAYIQILIHAVNDSLSPMQTRVPPLFSPRFTLVSRLHSAVFLATLGQQWVSRYLSKWYRQKL
ncbi:hypothetical protein BDM02DRAFT_3124702 [Thelephora ganbajun]|uniref:Uncharacterized protein n=1 Tax=Thelephora ganbajun TaxID=370292 RepID=A0ACB6YYL7_THEGA|nr:hypothetical protein BDM02DRAFT_3124702 [Thelephora ganbajun]